MPSRLVIAYPELPYIMAPVWTYGNAMMQTILMLAGLIQATVLLGFWGAALALLICGVLLIFKFISPLLLKFLF